jgi:hypothetical protein
VTLIIRRASLLTDSFTDSLKIGDRVLAFNEKTSKTDYYAITAVLIHKNPVLTEVLLDGEHIETTPHHPFYTQEKGWVYAGELKIGMHVRKADGSYGLVWLAWNVEREQVMYNLTVDTAHTYFVGQGQWLVHNTGGCNITAGNGASIDNISPEYRARIERFAVKNDTEVTVIGSRAEGAAGPESDWDYFIGGNSKVRWNARNGGLPRGLSGEEMDNYGNYTGIDVFNANTETMFPFEQWIRFTP